MLRLILSFFLICICSLLYSQDIKAQVFAETKRNGLLGKTIKQAGRLYKIDTSVSDSIKIAMLAFTVKAELILGKGLNYFDGFKIDKVYICLSKTKKISAYVLVLSKHSSDLKDSLIKFYGEPTFSGYINTDEVFHLPHKHVNIFWKFKTYGIWLMNFFINETDCLLLITVMLMILCKPNFDLTIE